jgi:hypothetical protein
MAGLLERAYVYRMSWGSASVHRRVWTVGLAALLCAVQTGTALATVATFTVRDVGVATPGTAHVPVTLVLASGFSTQDVSVSLKVTPQSGSPDLGTVTFTSSATMGSPTVFNNADPGTCVAAWFSHAQPLSGTVNLGTLNVPIPSSAQPGDTYKVTIPYAEADDLSGLPYSCGFSATAVITVTPTATPVPCVGDCGGGGSVTVDEILTMVNIALGNTDISACTAGDANGDGQITVDEILTAVNKALNGCGAS